MFKKYHFPVLCLLVGLWRLPDAADPADKSAEITSLRKELATIQTQRSRNRDDMAADRKEAENYTARTAQRRSELLLQIEEIKTAIALGAKIRDSLAALINLTRNSRKEIDLSEDQLRQSLITTCDRIAGMAQQLPPMINLQTSASAGLLKAELQGKNVENIEAMNRLIQMLGRLDEATGSIQVSQESSPFADIRGTVYRLRSGTFFEGMVDLKGEKAALWRGNAADGTPTWLLVNKINDVQALYQTAGIREGKRLPALGRLPLAPDSSKGGN